MKGSLASLAAFGMAMAAIVSCGCATAKCPSGPMSGGNANIVHTQSGRLYLNETEIVPLPTTDPMGDSLIAELKKVHARVPIKTITYLREEGTKPFLDIPTAARIQKFADKNLILVAPARTWEDRLPWGIPIRH